MATNTNKYSVAYYSISGILGSIETNRIAIPEIQRPFVWKPLQVRDLLDSLYNGYPTGYLIIWQNPSVKLKDGKEAAGKEILIDGQQRVTALMAAVAGKSVTDDDYKEKFIKIAFNPIAENDEPRFEVKTPAHEKSKHWIPDVSVVFKPGFSSFTFITEYIAANPGVDIDKVNQAITNLLNIQSCLLGAITLNADLDIADVTEIFVRINSKGARLNQSDFVMSKIAADEQYGGNTLRKAIDYFCHLAVKPEFYSQLEKNDPVFMQSEYAQKLRWLKDDKEEIYDPGYDDMLRVAFMHKFGKGKLSDLVSLISGRDFSTRTYNEEIAENSFCLLKQGVLDFMNEHNFEQFIISLKSAGFVSPKLLNSRMTLDFAYTLSLNLKASDSGVSKNEIIRYVQKWFVLTTLTSRYTTSPESRFDRDFRSIESKGFINFFKETEAAELSDIFWDVQLVQHLETSSVSSPYFNVYTAAQICKSEKSLLSSTIKVSDLLTTSGDVHHIFPKEYLKSKGITDKSMYNQVANYVYLDTRINISIGKRAPSEYLTEELEKSRSGGSSFGTINNEADFWQSIETNCIPKEIINMTSNDYEDFLQKRRKLMAMKIKDYYCNL